MVSGLKLHGLLDANLFKMAVKQYSLSQSGQGLRNQVNNQKTSYSRSGHLAGQFVYPDYNYQLNMMDACRI